MFCCRIRDDTRSAGFGGSRHWRCVEGLFCCAEEGRERCGRFVPFSFGASLRSFQRQRVSPAPPRHRASEVPTCPNKAVGAAARRFGSAFALYNGSTTTKPAPRGLCEKSPNLAAELPLPLGAARRRWRLVVPCSSQRWLCRVPPVGVGVVRCVSPTAASGTFHPAPPSACALLASPLCRACPLRLSGRSRS